MPAVSAGSARYGKLAIGPASSRWRFVNVADHWGLVAPFREPIARFSTTLSIALPGTDRQPPVLDMATSSVAMGKIRVARDEGEPAPRRPHRPERQPTRDPERDVQRAARRAAAFGRQGLIALAVVTELLAAALSGGATIQPAMSGAAEPSTTCSRC